MKMQAVRRGESLYIYLAGELDECSVSRTREEADALIDGGTGCRIAVFNLAGVSFMEWLGKPDDETQIPDDEDGDEGVTENPLG